MQSNFIDADSISPSSILLLIAAAFLGCTIASSTDAADRAPSSTAIFQAEVGEDPNDDQELSLRELLENESNDDPSTDSPLDQSDDSEALKVAKSKQDAIHSALARLRKPIQRVRVINSLGNLDGPTNASSQSPGHERASTFVTNSGSILPRYQRRTVCFSHRPLYFQDENLERCGNGRGCMTNAFSAVHFVSSVAMLPCKMAKQHPNCPVHAGGDCRCGQSKPVDLDLFPIDLHAAAVQAATVAGFSFLLL